MAWFQRKVCDRASTNFGSDFFFTRDIFHLNNSLESFRIKVMLLLMADGVQYHLTFYVFDRFGLLLAWLFRSLYFQPISITFRHFIKSLPDLWNHEHTHWSSWSKVLLVPRLTTCNQRTLKFPRDLTKHERQTWLRSKAVASIHPCSFKTQ